MERSSKASEYVSSKNNQHTVTKKLSRITEESPDHRYTEEIKVRSPKPPPQYDDKWRNLFKNHRGVFYDLDEVKV